MSRNNILLRIENIGDNFDTNISSNSTTYFKIKEYAAYMYQNANNGKNSVTLSFINVDELSLSGN